MSITLFMDEGNEGFKDKCQSVEELREKLDGLLDERVIEITIKKKGID